MERRKIFLSFRFVFSTHPLSRMFPLLFWLIPARASVFPGGGGTPLQEANRDVPLDGVAVSIDLLEWGRKFSDFGGK